MKINPEWASEQEPRMIIDVMDILSKDNTPKRKPLSADNYSKAFR